MQASSATRALTLPFEPPFTAAAAQLSTVQADVSFNLSAHLRFIRFAARYEVDLLVFPELSLTGYELPRAQELAFSATSLEDDQQLLSLREACKEAGLTVVAGLPLRLPPPEGKGQDKLHIASLIFPPDGGPPAIYTKQHLDSEDPPFSAGYGGPCLHFKPSTSSASSSSTSPGQGTAVDELVALAICADTSQPSHPHSASVAGASLYCASSCMSQRGYLADTERLASYAQAYEGMAILVANHATATGGFDCKGGSTAWGGEGRQQVVSGTREGREELVLLRKRDRSGEAGGWEGEVIRL
ncbi:hypothetical protein JCM11251_005277 [Rhodosporidiobolus azoricus]